MSDTKTIATPLTLTQTQPCLAPQAISTTSLVGKTLSVNVLWNIEFGSRIFRLNQPLVVKVIGECRGWTNECDELGLFSYGETPEKAREEFAAEFALTWDGVAIEPDEMLTIDAKKLKRRLRDYVKKIESSRDEKS